MRQAHNQYTMEVGMIIRFLIAVAVFSVSAIATSAPAVDHSTNSPISFTDTQYRLEVEDMRVKVQGGYIRSTRTWVNGGWEFNRRWLPLSIDGQRKTFSVGSMRFSTQQGTSALCGPDSLTEAVSKNPYGASLSKGGSTFGGLNEYVEISAGAEAPSRFYTYVLNGKSEPEDRIVDYSQWIDLDESTIYWQNDEGDVIRYDDYGHIQNYSDRNGNTQTFRFDGNGNIAGVRDANGTEVLTFAYQAKVVQMEERQEDGTLADVNHTVYLPISATDYTGRQVQYTYNDDVELVGVTDVNGKSWLYGYSDQSALQSITDPVGRTTQIQQSGGTIQSVLNADGEGLRYSFSGGAEDSRQVRSKVGGAVVETWFNHLNMKTKELVNGEIEFEGAYEVRLDGEWEAVNYIKISASMGGGGGGGSSGSGSTGTTIRMADSCRSFSSSGGLRVGGGGGSASVTLSAGQGEMIKYSYLDKGTVTDRYSETYELRYNTNGKVVSRKRLSDGAVETTSWHSKYSLPVNRKEFNGVTTTYQYDGAGNLLTLTEAKGTPAQRVTSYTWDTYGNMLTATYAADATTALAQYTYHYDNKGNVTSTDGPSGSVSFVDAEFPQHDVLGNSPVRIDERGKRWLYTYDDAGNRLTAEDPLGRVTGFIYNDAGDATGVTLPNQSDTNWTVNHSGKPLVVTNALEQNTTFTYDTAGRLSAIKLPGGATQSFGYNARGLLAKHVDASGYSTTYSYDGARLKEVAYPTYNESYALDVLGRISQGSTTAESDGINQQRSYNYDKVGNPKLFTDAENRGTASDYDALDRRVAITDAKGGVTTLAYDDRDNLIGVTDPEQSTTTFTYDASDRLITETRPEGETRHYTYYANGLRETETNGKGEITLYTYDDAGQLTHVKYFASATARTNGTVGKTVDFTYNDLGLLASYDDSQTSGVYTYDVLGRLQTVAVNYGPFSKSHSYTYDSDGRRKTYTNPEDVTYTYQYTANGDFQSLTIPNEGAIAVTQYHWRSPAQWLFPGGTQITTLSDGLLRPYSTSLIDPGANSKASRVYTYNAENHITGIATEEGAHNYTLDELYRLTAAAFEIETQLQNEAYSYDGVGNRTTENGGGEWQYNDNHQLESTPQATYGYDDNGHTTSKTVGAVVTTYEYDLAERMRAVKQDGVELGSYKYDPFGRRTSKTVAGVTTYFYYDDTGLLAEYDGAGQLISEYHYKPGSTWMTNPLFKRDGASNKVHYYYNSHLGQPLKLFDKSGKTTWAGRSQAFGGASVFVNEVENNLRFPGQYEDGESGLFYNFFRYYDSQTGRYLRSDPAGFEGGINPYLYVGSSPLEFIDPLGLWSIGDPLPQSYVNAFAGFGDGIIAAMSLGLLSGQDLRDAAGVYGGVNPCSPEYQWGYGTGMAVGIAATLGVGAEALVAGALRAVGTRMFARYGGSLRAAHAAKINPNIYKQLEKQLAKDGPNSISKALRSAEKTLQAHKDKLPGLQHKSQVEGTIRRVEGQIATLKQFIKDSGL